MEEPGWRSAPRTAAQRRRRRATARRARLRSPGQLWGRRTILVGLAVIALAVVGSLSLLADDGGNQSPVEEGVDEEQSELGESLDDANSGISVNWPSDWNKLEKGGVFGFQSPDKMVLVAISAPADAAAADQLRKDAIASTAAEYQNPLARPGKGRSIGGLRSEGAAISGKGASGQSATLVAVAAGKRKAYLLEVYTAADAPSERLVDAQLIVNSLQLSK
ncbi:MAG: hypothetical protein ACRDK5_11775 [Solirubrobacterales bacterium]